MTIQALATWVPRLNSKHKVAEKTVRELKGISENKMWLSTNLATLYLQHFKHDQTLSLGKKKSMGSPEICDVKMGSKAQKCRELLVYTL